MQHAFLKIAPGIVLLFFLLTGSVAAQDCSKSTVYFRKNQSALRKDAEQTIDSLLAQLDTATHYLIELHAYADSSNTILYNLRLAGMRNLSVMNRVRSIRRGNVVFLTRNYGEGTSGADRKEDRRVDVYVFPLDDKDRIVLKGSRGETAAIAYQSFSGCGYCKDKPEIRSLMEKEDGALYFKLELTNSCEMSEVSGCREAEFRIPYTVFNASGALHKLRSIYGYNCNTGKVEITEKMKSDSLFTIGFDTLTREYVIRYACYRKDCIWLCGGSPQPCLLYTFLLPEEVTAIRTTLSFQDKPWLGGRKPAADERLRYERFDSLYRFGLPCPQFRHLYSYGVRNGELVFAKCTIDELIYKRIGGFRQERGMLFDTSRIELIVPPAAYKPMRYTQTTMRLKVPRGVVVNSASLYLEAYDFHLPMRMHRSGCLIIVIPDMEYAISIVVDGKEQLIPFSQLKKRYKKRRHLLKVKVRRRDLDRLPDGK